MGKINWDDNKLTDDIRKVLETGTKVRFKWHGNSDMVYDGRIRKEGNTLYFIPEHLFEGDPAILEAMRNYNTLDSFYHFTMFEIIS